MKPLVTILLLIVDALGSGLALKVTYSIRYQSGMFNNQLPAELWYPMIVLTLFWWALFGLNGMYRTPVALSRFDEVIKCFKVVAIGLIVIFIATFDVNDPLEWTRIFLVTYGGIGWVAISMGRLLVRNYQRKLRQRNIGLWNGIIVGWNDNGRRLHTQLHQYPVWGFNIVGFVDEQPTAGEHHGVKLIGTIERLPELIREHRVGWVLVAPESGVQDILLKVIEKCVSSRVRFMIVADYYHMVVGMMRTVQIHGLPLVEVVPHLVSERQLIVKRIADIIVGLVGSAITLLLFPFIAIAVKLSGIKRVICKIRFIGRFEREIAIRRFGTSRGCDPLRQSVDMPRFGKFLRKTQLNDLPLFFSLLKGDLSLVGPELERVDLYRERHNNIPLYERRFMIRPGLTGWTQLRSKSGESPKDIYEKTGYDLFYIDHLSPSLDLKIIATTLWKIVRGAWN